MKKQNKSKKAIIYLTLILNVFVFYSLSVYSNDKIIDFNLSTLDKEKFELNSVLGKKKIVINFWATWCTACVIELPELRTLKEKNKRDTIFLAINAGEKVSKIKRFLKRYDFPYKVLLDSNRNISKKWGVLNLPRTIVISKQKKIIYNSNKPPKRL